MVSSSILSTDLLQLRPAHVNLMSTLVVGDGLQGVLLMAVGYSQAVAAGLPHKCTCTHSTPAKYTLFCLKLAVLSKGVCKGRTAASKASTALK